MRKKKSITYYETIIYAALILFSLAVIYPFYYTVMNSFNADIAKGPALLWPETISFKSYGIIFKTNQLVNAFIMSVTRTVLGIFGEIMVCSFCAYALRKRDLAFRNFYLIVFTIPMFFGGGVIPMYLNFKMLGLIDNFLIYILPYIFSFFYIIILMSSFNEIPDSLEESAKIDGAKHFTILTRIYMPVTIPILATIALFSGVDHWNRWFDTMYFTKSSSLMTLSGILIRIITKNSASQELAKMASRDSLEMFQSVEAIKMATMVVSIVPILFIYPFFQRYFVKGITIGSVKG